MTKLIDYPSLNHKKYIESVYRFCEKNEFSMILKGSLAKGTATKYSDIDLVILGNIARNEVDELIPKLMNAIKSSLMIVSAWE